MLADRIGLERFSIVGVSGGGPFALACGQRLGARIDRIGIVCGMGELDDGARITGMHPAAAFGLSMSRQVPWFAQWSYGHLVAPVLGRFPGAVFRLLSAAASPADREVLEDPAIHATISASFKEAFRAGGDGPAQELGLFLRPWDIAPEEVRVPVQLWHGEADRTVPAAMGRRLAERLPDCEARFLPDEGHFSLVVRHIDAVLARLVDALP